MRSQCQFLFYHIQSFSKSYTHFLYPDLLSVTHWFLPWSSVEMGAPTRTRRGAGVRGPVAWGGRGVKSSPHLQNNRNHVSVKQAQCTCVQIVILMIYNSFTMCSQSNKYSSITKGANIMAEWWSEIQIHNYKMKIIYLSFRYST